MRLSPWSIDSFMHSLNIHVKPTLYQSQARDAKLVIAPAVVEALAPSMTGRGVSVVVGGPASFWALHCAEGSLAGWGPGLSEKPLGCRVNVGRAPCIFQWWSLVHPSIRALICHLGSLSETPTSEVT